MANQSAFQKPTKNTHFEIFPIANGVNARLWADDLTRDGPFSLDFVDGNGKPMRKPHQMTFMVFSGTTAPIICYSIAESVGPNGARCGPALARDLDWHTYLVPQGTTLSFEMPNCNRVCLKLPLYMELLPETVVHDASRYQWRL
jgi:hypothetical protein